MGQLWQQNIGLVRTIATYYKSESDRLYDSEDLLQEGYFGLYRAALKYQPERGAAFSTYAVYHLRRAFRVVTGRYGKRDALFDARSLDIPLKEKGAVTPLDFLAGHNDEYCAEQDNLSQIMRAAVSHIEDKPARQMIEAVYWQGKSVAQVADEAHIVRATVYQRLERGYATLRHDKYVKALALAEGLNYRCHLHKGLSSFKSSLSSSVEDAVMQHERIKKREAALFCLLGELANPIKP